MYSPEYVPPLTAMMMYCLPCQLYVMGEPLTGAGIHTAPTSLPVALSYARIIAPRGCVTEVIWLSPRITSDLVISTPTLPFIPVLPMFMPFSAGELRMLSGVSPYGTCHFRSPLFTSTAEITPYGG